LNYSFSMHMMSLQHYLYDFLHCSNFHSFFFFDLN
jgi:hypothetical protein